MSMTPPRTCEFPGCEEPNGGTPTTLHINPDGEQNWVWLCTSHLERLQAGDVEVQRFVFERSRPS